MPSFALSADEVLAGKPSDSDGERRLGRSQWGVLRQSFRHPCSRRLQELSIMATPRWSFRLISIGTALADSELRWTKSV